MDWEFLELHFSKPRLWRYLCEAKGNINDAQASYAANIALSSALLPLLSTIEVALRNAIHRKLSERYKSESWWTSLNNHKEFRTELEKINQALGTIKHRKEKVDNGKVVAELTFGFWCALFNKKYENLLWKDLRIIFGNCPKESRQRVNISKKVDQIRRLRNRVFHHEPILWLEPSLDQQYQDCLTLLNWLDGRLVLWLQRYDTFPQLWQGHINRSRCLT